MVHYPKVVFSSISSYRYKEFESLIHKWRLRSGEFQDEYLWKISDADLIAHKQKVEFLLFQINSLESKILVIMTIVNHP